MRASYNWLLGLLALASGTASALGSDRKIALAPGLSPADFADDPSITKTVVKRHTRDGGWTLAAHRSHSSHRSHGSHSSHRSHYSGSGGGLSLPPAVVPRPVSPPSPAAAPRASTPPSAASSEAEKLAMRVQLALNSGGFCSCKVDGEWGAETEKGLRKFQEANGLRPSGVPDLETLRKLGISF